MRFLSWRWPQPKSRDVGLFSDFSLFAESLTLARERGCVSAPQLRQELDQRVRGRDLLRKPSDRVAAQLIRELRDFKWIVPDTDSNATSFLLTEAGQAVLHLWNADRREFRRELTRRMQAVYVTPAWFVSRLWMINPVGQGEVIIPAPRRDWKPKSLDLGDNEWHERFEGEARRAALSAQAAVNGAFPVQIDHWLETVRNRWDHQGRLEPKNPKALHFRPRQRLTLAMQEASIQQLFSRNFYVAESDRLHITYHDVPPRSFRAWCPRLAALELLSYTDTHQDVHGRLLFPTSVFRDTAPSQVFESLAPIEDPNGATLWLHQPRWPSIRKEFWKVLIQTHRAVSLRVQSLYVSLLDVRDEVCRQLRLSANSFDMFLTQGLGELPHEGFHYSVSVETDMREDQLSGPGLVRRPVFIGGTPHTLLAVAHLPTIQGAQ